ncbi:MAG: DNA starvation/stationary phase protection protein Dps [Anaerolineae bacterium]|nr:DNA starvation/stationary phase protection protein Dps [Anaerolineae bacterium]
MATQTKSPHFDTKIDLEKEVLSEIIAILNEQMADSFVLFSHTKQAHWNVKGMDFIQLHELFDELAGELLAYVDMMAERITALGGTALGTVEMAAGATTLPDVGAELGSGEEFLEALIERYGSHANAVREAIDTTDELGDMGTSDLFTEVVRGLDKSLYFLEAHLRA